MSVPTAEIQWRCLKCLKVNQDKASPAPRGPWTCRNCGASEPPRENAFDAEGAIIGCPACGCPDIYRQRDFNRKLGIAIVAAGAALAPYTMFLGMIPLSVIACVFIDVAMHRFVPDAVICYHCHAVMRGYPGAERVGLFDLNTSDKYIDVERKRGW